MSSPVVDPWLDADVSIRGAFEDSDVQGTLHSHPFSLNRTVGFMWVCEEVAFPGNSTLSFASPTGLMQRSESYVPETHSVCAQKSLYDNIEPPGIWYLNVTSQGPASYRYALYVDRAPPGFE